MAPDRDANKTAVRLEKQVFSYHEVSEVLDGLHDKIRKKVGGVKLD